MNILAIAVTTGRGGKEFEREADAFAEHWQKKGETCVLTKIRKQRPYDMRKEVLKIIKKVDFRIDTLVFFCHGTWKHLKCGFHIWNVGILAKELIINTAHLRVVLYACSTGLSFSGAGSGRLEWPWKLSRKNFGKHVLGKHGFAARLAWALNKHYIKSDVFAHSSRGHTTRNPYCYRFTSLQGDIIRYPLQRRGGANWKIWKQRMKTSERFEVPFE